VSEAKLEKQVASDVFGFLWRAPAGEGGYRWVRSRVLTEDGQPEGESGWVLTEAVTAGQSYRVRQYAPLKTHVALFRTFATVPPGDRDAILRFAADYGNLGIARPVEPAPASPGPLSFGETWESWAKAIAAMRRAVELWDLVEAGDRVALSRFVSWHRRGRPLGTQAAERAEGWYYDNGSGATAYIEPVLDLFRSDDAFTPAAFLVQRWINRGLNEYGMDALLLYDPETGKRAMHFVPRNLLSVLWLQFAQAIEGDRQYRACKECGKWFGISLEGDGRSNRRLFCSDPCKSKDYRRRKERSRVLKGEGKSAAEIAEELETELKTVKGWIKGNKEK
jgi:hypothetical protein